MLDLFAMEFIVKDAVLVSDKSNQYHKVEIKESTGVYPYQVSVVSGSGQQIHGRQSYSFNKLEEAEERFNTFLSSYCEDGFSEKMVS
ncbi:hypothetical protein CVD28_01860 [Bacillus sp. M6-12]|uniref:hypothetical protein n=1 Tax=Bacillus sp. M6-12 TaxID=2054166 RepID=UPI000C7923CF|nr:hypothetical protein [Bacillus sp. M6-12]PLS19177.1 hypothetical protein CVD28_01860 [Bacillus sp. M6-12]